MADKTINVKIREAYDTEQNWRQNDPVLYSGQLAISSDKHGMYKVGNGTATWSELDYASHPAQDVSSWAKESTKPTYTISEISDAGSLITNMTRTNITDALGYTPIGEGNYVIQVDHGGTGKTTANEAANVFINALTDDQTKPVDSDYFISQYVNGLTTTTTYHRKPLSALWDYIKDKSDAAYLAINGTATKATILEQNRTIDGVAFNGSANVTHYGVCTTEAETAEKAVACNNFSLDTGSVITVKFTTTNTAQSNVTLNVNSTGAKSIKYRNSVAPSSSLFVAGRTYQFVYDGESYQLVGDIDTNIDTKVTQSLSTEDVDYPILFSYTNKNDTTADINNVSYRSNSIYANPQTGTLTVTTLKGYLDGNAKSAITSSFIAPQDSNTNYGASTNRGNITDGIVVFGESFQNTTDFLNSDDTTISDTGDITLWMKKVADNDVRLNMSIDGDYYANGDRVIAKLDEVVTLTGDQTIVGYKTFPGALMTDTLTITPPESNYGQGLIITPQAGTLEGGQITLSAPPDSATLPGIHIDQYNGKFRIFGNPSADETTAVGAGTPLVVDPYGKTITGGYTLTGHATDDVPITTGFGQNLSGYASSDDNTISGTVVRYSNGQATGKPTGTDHALFQMAYSDIWKTQLAQDWRTNKAYIRSCNNGTWGDWNALVSKDNIVYGRGNLNSNGTFDANGNVTLEDYGYGSNISIGQVATKPFLRFAYMNAGSASWYDCSIICLIDRGYNGGEWGIFKACIRTNDNSNSASFSASGAIVQWLVRVGIPTDAIQIGLHSQFQNNYASLFYKITGGYQGARITVLSQNHRGSLGRRWTFLNCSEDNNGNGTECYASIAAYSSALSTIVSGSDVGYVNTARNADYVHSNLLNESTGTGQSGCIPFTTFEFGNTATSYTALRHNNSLGFHYRGGKSGTAGYAIIQVGNGTAEQTANGTRGRVRIYGNNTGYSDLYTNVTTSSKAIYLPARGGTIFTTEMFSLSGTTLTISTS